MSDLLPDIEALSADKLVDLNEDTWRLFIVAHFFRPGQSAWMSELEERYYTPHTPRNKLFDLMLFHWQGLPWWIVGIPLQERQNVVEVNRRLKWRLANGVPLVLQRRKPQRGEIIQSAVAAARPQQFGPTSPMVIKAIFPLRSARTFTLEPDHVARGEAPDDGEPMPIPAAVHFIDGEGNATAEAERFMADMVERIKRHRANNAYRGN